MMHRAILLLAALLLAACAPEPAHDHEEGHGHAAHEHEHEHEHGEGGLLDMHATIPAGIAREAGIEVEEAGPARIRHTLRVMGTVAIDTTRQARVRARFPGVVREVRVVEGQSVRRGETLLVVEGNESMRPYPVTAPIDGVVLSRQAGVGEVTGDAPLVELADLSQLWVDLHAFGADAARLRAGQSVRLASATGDASTTATIQRLLPLATPGQGAVARIQLPNPQGQWRPGMIVSAEVTLAEHEVPLAVKEAALQTLRGATVVFEQEGDTYEARVLELGEGDGEYVEVRSGLAPGARYVTTQSYLIRADIEKSGAAHEH
jgi:cobalt-zinc-cadmium efflux system membrane fusion protein